MTAKLGAAEKVQQSNGSSNKTYSLVLGSALLPGNADHGSYIGRSTSGRNTQSLRLEPGTYMLPYSIVTDGQGDLGI